MPAAREAKEKMQVPVFSVAASGTATTKSTGTNPIPQPDAWPGQHVFFKTNPISGLAPNSRLGHQLPTPILDQGIGPAISNIATSFDHPLYDFHVRPRCTGKERDAESGLDYFGARYFSGAEGRFTSPDPITVTPGRMVDPQQLSLYAYARNNPLKYVDPTGMIIDTSQLSDEDKKKWEQIEALANQQDENGNYVNQKLHEAYDRLDSDSRTFVIVDQNLGDRTAGQFTITDFNGPNDFSKATVALNFKLIKGLGSPSTGDFDSTFKRFEGLFGKNGFILRLAETFGHEANHGIFALNDLQQGTHIQHLVNDRDAAMQALPKGKGRYPLPPDVLQKLQAAAQALIPTERFAQQAEKIINGELKANQVKK